MPASYGNRQKHESANPVQRALIGHFHRRLAELVHTCRPREILEIGCGEGYVLAALHAHGVRCPMTGVDLSPGAIAEATRRVPAARFAVQDARELASSGARYDLVLITEVLEHIPDPQRMLPVLEAVARRQLIASVPWEPFFRGLNFLRGKHVHAFGNDPEHVNHWDRAGFLQFLGERFAVRRAPWVFPWTLVACDVRAAQRAGGADGARDTSMRSSASAPCS